ncbi:glycosyl hydrolase 115 family protein [Paenibacillus sp. y28]|uniref:glycosyl hydrolase 115 family protein n=1 Tax=Paenibacillus sp. y28 TaxID=3129110 RepID=UPI003019D649
MDTVKSTEACVRIQKDCYLLLPENLTSAVRHALDMIARDHAKVFGEPPQMTLDRTAAHIVVRYAGPEDSCPQRPEAFSLRFERLPERPVLHIVGRDDLGLIYGLLHYSRYYLGVDPFWFWADLPVVRRSVVEIPCRDYDSPQPKVRYRGWFVNDEVCLIGWKEAYPPTREVWLPVFEALLRCGGNMVIPGTDLPKTGIHWDLASEMGLWITHHHAEPLGAEMFLRAYPGKAASYKTHPELFEQLWLEAIEKQKHKKLVWVLSFRGQGDAPFWENDPAFDTPSKRGALISRVVRKQYDMVHAAAADPVCCIALYGEIAELYKEGHIEVPGDVIKVWADNGYGKMVSRRQGNLNLRVPSLPAAGDTGKHGIYYHVTFHDLQASNHLTMIPVEADFLRAEVEAAFEAGASEYVLLNSGNIRPHLYPLDLIAALWTNGAADTGAHLNAFIGRLYTSHTGEIAALYEAYAEAGLPYGPNPDDRAGEEFYHHPARRIVGHWLQGLTGQADEGLLWATGTVPFAGQVAWFGQRCEAALPGWQSLKAKCEELLPRLSPRDRQRLADQLLLPVLLHESGCRGFIRLCRAFAAYEAGRYAEAFVHASQAMRAYAEGKQAMEGAEHGKWEHFYRADWLTNVESTVRSMDTLRRFLRMHGDSPDFFLWYKEYLMPETEKYIYLENTHRNPLSDDELAERLGTKFGLI